MYLKIITIKSEGFFFTISRVLLSLKKEIAFESHASHFETHLEMYIFIFLKCFFPNFLINTKSF